MISVKLGDNKMSDTKLATKRKPRRNNINGTRNVHTVQGKDPDFVYRIVNDDGDRISQFEEMGYDIVVDSNIKVGDRRIANPTKEGSPVQVSVGGGNKAFLMRIPKTWYDEDQADKVKRVTDSERGMLQEARDKNADYGKVVVSQ